MRKMIFIASLLIAVLGSAQTELPKTATEIAPLLIGEKVPNVNLQTMDGVKASTTDVIAQKKTILIFYRGGWCPYCNVHLKAIGEAEQELINLGYQIVAVSPDSPKKLSETKTEEKLNYSLLSDSNGEFAKAFGIAFQAPENYKPYIGKGSDGVNTSFLPVPSVFILNTKGEILFEFVTPDFKHRISNELLLAAAKSVNN